MRQCFPLDLTLARDVVDAQGPAANGVLLADFFTQLHESGALVSADAPDQELLVRMVTTTLSCDQIAQLPHALVAMAGRRSRHASGASRSSAAAMPGRSTSTRQHGAVFLGLPTLDAVNCVPQAAVCAADFDPRQSAALLGF